MSKINVAVECNKEHRASVYTLVTSMVANKGLNSEYCIYMLLGNSSKAEWSKLLTLKNERVDIVLYEGDLSELTDVKRLICLKWNTLVMGDLTELYETNLDGKAFAAAENLPDTESAVPNSIDEFNKSVMLLDIHKRQNVDDYKRIPVFYNYGYEEYVKEQTALKEYKKARDWALIIRMDEEHSPEKYCDAPLAPLWMKYYMVSPMANEPQIRSAYAETVGEFEREINNAIPILMEVEDRSVEYIAKAISILEQNLRKEKNLDIRLVYNQMSAKNKNRLVGLANNRVKIVLYNMKSYNMMQSRTSKEVLASLIFAEYDKAICLAPGVLVEDDISRIYDLDMGDYLIRALRTDKFSDDTKDFYLREVENIDTTISVINVKYWIERLFTEQIQSMLNDKEYKGYTESEVINVFCMKQRGFISEKLNIRVCDEFLDGTSEDEDVKEVLAQIQKLEAKNKQLQESNQRLKAENKQLSKEKDRYLYEITEIRKSMTYKLGRTLTLIPRKLRGDK